MIQVRFDLYIHNFEGFFLQMMLCFLIIETNEDVLVNTAGMCVKDLVALVVKLQAANN